MCQSLPLWHLAQAVEGLKVLKVITFCIKCNKSDHIRPFNDDDDDDDDDDDEFF